MARPSRTTPEENAEIDRRYEAGEKLRELAAEFGTSVDAIHSRRYRERHPDRWQTNLSRWREENPEKLKTYRKTSRARNPDYYREKARRDAAARKERDPDWYAKYRESNAEKVAEYQRRHRAENPSYYREKARREGIKYRDERLAREHRRRASMRGVTAEDVSRERVWLRDGGYCGICGAGADHDDWHLDHIVPLARGGTHTYDNVQVAHPKCNLGKGAKAA